APPDIVTESRIVEELRRAHHFGPAFEQRLSDHLYDDPAIGDAENVRGARDRAAIAGSLAIDAQGRFFYQRSARQVQRSLQQLGFDALSPTARAAFVERQNGAQR